MSKKNSYTTSDYIPWDSAISLIHRLYRDGDYRMSLFVATGIFTGLRVSDMLALKWSQLLSNSNLVVVEKKTCKRREIRLNPEFQAHVRDCFRALSLADTTEHCFLSQKNTVFSIQRLNVKLKLMKRKYNIPVNNISCHSLRKTMGRRIFEMAGTNSEMALIKLCEVFGHSTPQITRRYLGLKREEVLETYDLLSF